MPVTQQSPMAVSGARYTFIAKEATISVSGPFCIVETDIWKAGALTHGQWNAGSVASGKWSAGHFTHDTSCN